MKKDHITVSSARQGFSPVRGAAKIPDRVGERFHINILLNLSISFTDFTVKMNPAFRRVIPEEDGDRTHFYLYRNDDMITLR